jgi:hypothetical protein
MAHSTLDPAFMMKPLLRAFAATLMGGLMSIRGEVIGGEILGLVENLFGYFWLEWEPIVAFLVIDYCPVHPAQRTVCKALCEKSLNHEKTVQRRHHHPAHFAFICPDRCGLWV